MNEVLDSVKEMDRIISNMSRNRRILYFQSENRNVIEKAVNASVALQYLLNIPLSDDRKSCDNLFRMLRKTQKCLNCTRYYKQSGGVGRFDLAKGENPLFLYLSDFQTFTREEERAHILKAFLDLCEEWELKNYNAKGGSLYLLLSSPQCLIPDGFSDSIELIREQAVTEHDLFLVLAENVRAEEKARGRDYYTDEQLQEYSRRLIGLTEGQIQSIFERLGGRFCTEMDKNLVRYVSAEKRKEGEKDPVIRFREIKKEPNVAGLGNYMSWLKDREESFLNPGKAARMGMPAPKGVLLCGVPGTGKTQMAKETAWRLQVDLIQFDIGRLSSKEYGSSEAKMAHFLNRVCANAPCVMLIDEIEKTFHEDREGQGMHEVKLQQLSQLLDWMQSREENVLTFITANNIAQLPAELLRDGRINGRFFAFMPTHDDLMAILWSKLLPYATEGIFGKTFCTGIQKACNRIQDSKACSETSSLPTPIDEVLDRIVRPDPEGEFTSRTPFMTGANLESLIETTNRELHKRGKLSGCSAREYAEQFIKCGQSPAFVPQGQSNMADIVDMWLKAQKKQYQEVSANALLPFGAFRDGHFVDELPIPENDYDKYLQSRLKEEIEGAAERVRLREDAFIEYQKNKEKKENRT